MMLKNSDDINENVLTTQEYEKITSRVKVMIAIEDDLSAEKIRRCLKDSNKFSVIGIVNNGRDAISTSILSEIDVIILDVSLPYIDGMTVMKTIANINKRVKFLFYSSYEESWIIQKCLNEGAAAYVNRRSKIDSLIDAINLIAGGGAYLDDFTMQILLNKHQTKPTNYEKISVKESV